jgi:hypothetical protein
MASLFEALQKEFPLLIKVELIEWLESILLIPEDKRGRM